MSLLEKIKKHEAEIAVIGIGYVGLPLATEMAKAVPAAGKAYIIRFSLDVGVCRFELFRVVPNADPVREPLTHPEPQSCLFH